MSEKIKTISKEIKNPRVRIAPSPTGYFHIGTARTALFNYLVARKYNGKFILRIEDTDKERSKKEYEEDILENLKWLKLFWDEGIEVDGPYGPYRQSERLDIYEKYLKELINKGLAYYCFCTVEELEYKRQEMMSRGEAPRYDGHCRNLSQEEIEEKLKNKTPYVIRLKMPEKEIIISDLIRGKVKFNTKLIGDFIIAKGLRNPLYNFSVVVDDYEMHINYVIRGEEHLPNTPRQIAIYEAFGWEPPIFAHLPLILNPDRSKMSKRFGDVAMKDFRKKGYLPEAIINFLVFLGWHLPEKNGETINEILTLDEIIEQFDFFRIQKAGAIFNIDKLDWINAEYIERLPIDELTSYAVPFLTEKFGENILTDIEFIKKIIETHRQRIKTLAELPEIASYFFILPDYDVSLLYWQNMTKDELISNLDFIYKLFLNLDNKLFTKQQLEAIIMPEVEKRGRGNVLWPLRVALSGSKNSAGPFEIMEVLGKSETLKRIANALNKLNN
ncbi:MAG TPA: glutamate--tRNA ligase [Candidatus Paceibacterota bacterium]|jgi:glutamyl-tRNA synthetase|nr:glutamate--tRNA ligase [Candidatus Paceibacterota bacterium]HPC37504.1 glutamate--tRNA ligase [Candidatus Paceibacterota bacterium]HRU35968.1 glutamate--tRNA ligase [Candidatus Paceibacterota bacterium]